MPIPFVIATTIVLACVWSVPVILVGRKQKRNEIPKKNFFMLVKFLFWFSLLLSAIAQIQYVTGLNETLADPSIRAQWMAFLWPISFASSLGGFFARDDPREHRSAAAKLAVSFLLLIAHVVSLMG